MSTPDVYARCVPSGDQASCTAPRPVGMLITSSPDWRSNTLTPAAPVGMLAIAARKRPSGDVEPRIESATTSCPDVGSREPLGTSAINCGRSPSTTALWSAIQPIGELPSTSLIRSSVARSMTHVSMTNLSVWTWLERW